MNFKKYQGGAVNKFNKDATDTNNGYLNNTFLRDDNTTSVSSAWAVSEYIDISGISTLSAKNANTSSIITAICYYNDSKAFISGTAYNGTSTQTFTVPSNTKYCRMSYVKPASATMLVEGSTVPSEYHPYYEWNSIPYRKYATSTDTITTLPAVIYANDTTATVGLKGNMSQASGVSPTTPIQPQECGERTRNLFDYVAYFDSTFTAYNQFFNYATIQLKPNTTYTLSTSIIEQGSNPRNTAFIVATTNQTPTTASGGLSNVSPITITTESDGVLKLYKRISGTGVIPTKAVFDNGDWIMLNSGSTALPYEPYGYKIPILMGGTTNNKYLGEVQSTRKIKKLVLNGSEPWVLSGNIVYINNTDTMKLSPLICTHFPNVQNTGIWNGNNWIFQVDISNLGMSGRDAWISYLQQQYTNGTPVTLWYVLATPETAVVNEPLRKIGDYADEVSGITIPTIAGANTITVDTTLQPSEVSVNYKGWHPVQSVHEAENDAWT